MKTFAVAIVLCLAASSAWAGGTNFTVSTETNSYFLSPKTNHAAAAYRAVVILP
jgi:hypothetical protein